MNRQTTVKKRISVLGLTFLLLSLGTLQNLHPTSTYDANSFSFNRRYASSSVIDEASSKIESELYSLGIEDNISKIKILHDFDGNEYIFGLFSKQGYGIYNINNSDVVELAPFASLPFNWDCTDVIYLPWVGFFERNNSNYFDAKTNIKLEDSYVSSLQERSKQFAKQSVLDAKNKPIPTQRNILKTSTPSTNHDPSNEIITADHEVPYSWYFKKNINSFQYNSNNTCGYIAASLLLAYSEIFKCTGYFSAEEAKKYITPYTGIRTFNTKKKEYEWDGVPDYYKEFPTDVWGENIGDAQPSTIDKAIHAFLNDRNKDVQYHNYFYYWKFASVTKPINDGFPAALFGMLPHPDTNKDISHTAVVYGYFDSGKLLCHFGWHDYSQVVMSELGLAQQGAVLSIYNESEHRHNEYFIDKYSGRKYCGCGELMSC